MSEEICAKLLTVPMSEEICAKLLTVPGFGFDGSKFKKIYAAYSCSLILREVKRPGI